MLVIGNWYSPVSRTAVDGIAANAHAVEYVAGGVAV